MLPVLGGRAIGKAPHLVFIRSALLVFGTHRAGHDKVGLGVEVAAEDVVAVTFQGF